MSMIQSRRPEIKTKKTMTSPKNFHENPVPLHLPFLSSNPHPRRPRADKGGEGKSKRAENIYGTKKSKERREEPLGTMSFQTSSKRSPPFWLLIGARKLVFFWHKSEARTAATVWDWSGKTLSPGALLAVLYFSSFHIFFRLFLVPTICPWVSEDV